MAKRRAHATPEREALPYRHPESEVLLRPDVGTQDQFKKKKPPVTYRYDSSLSPALDWDGQNSAREQGEALIRQVLDAESLEEAKAAAEKLRALGQPFLDWAGKAEHLSFDVPTLPLFVHERLSTTAIIETLRGHKNSKETQPSLFDLFGDPERDITDQVLKAYEYQDEWVNRMVLGDSLVVMNSLLHYEGLGGQVQMVYMDPPYGVKFGSNFQPFIRRRGVKHNDDEHLTREPETVQAYRDTWELGLHSYLTYLRDRLLLCRELLHSSGSIFVQISDENLHHVRELLDEVFGQDNFVSIVAFSKTTGLEAAKRMPARLDYLLWYGKDAGAIKYHPLYEKKDAIESGFNHVEMPGGARRPLTSIEKSDPATLPKGARLFMLDNLTKPGPGAKYDVEFGGATYTSGARWWGMPKESLLRLIELNRVGISGKSLRYVRYHDDFPLRLLTNLWTGLGGASNPLYVVQTSPEVIKRCILMTSDPGDLVLDPTCGGGTTAYVAEQWGRRWLTTDVSRVPLTLARQRLLTATYPWFELLAPERGPSGGFNYSRKQNRKGEEIGGLVPRTTSSSLANDSPANDAVVLDQPDASSSVTRVTGPFCLEASIPTPHNWNESEAEDGAMFVSESIAAYGERMLEVLRKSPLLRLEGGRAVKLKNVRPPAKTLSLSAEALVENGDEKPVAFVFGPENGAVSQNLAYHAAREAYAKNYTHLYVIGFAIQPTARKLIDDCAKVVGVAATYVQATPDLLMGDLLKNMRSSQIFSVCGLPEVKVHKKSGKFQVELIGLDVFDPISMDVDGRSGDDVPAWLLDIDYNGLCFHVSQAFFPRTSAWDSLKKALKGTHDEAVWDHLSGTLSAPFEAGEHDQVAVKVIDDRGNELMVVESLGS